MGVWHVRLEGGSYDGWTGRSPDEPPPMLIAWECPGERFCPGHITDSADDPGIVIQTAECYQRDEVDLDERLAIYKVGEPAPDHEEQRELAGVGASDLGDGWPVSP